MDLGKLGEGEFKRRCQLSNMIANEALDDKRGWDFVVELDTQITSPKVRNENYQSRKVFVQVKSTMKKVKSARAKISALKHLVDTDFPTFIAHIQYDAHYQPVCIRMLHIGRIEIETITKEVLTRENRGQVAFGNAKMSISLDKSVELVLDRESLRQAISSAIGDDDAAYCKSKSTFRRTCGFGPDAIRASFSPQQGVKVEDLVDLMLGLKENISVDHFSVEMNRFGIPINSEDPLGGPGTLTVGRKPVQTGLATAISANGLKRQIMPINLFSPNIPDLPESLRKFRAHNSIIDVLFNPYTGEGQCRGMIDVELQWDLKELSAALNFASILVEASSSVEIQFPSLQFQIKNNAGIQAFRSFGILREFTSMAASAVAKFDHSRTVYVSIADMRQALDQNRTFFAATIKPGAEFTFTDLEPNSPSVPKYGSIYLPIVIDFQNLSFQIIVRAEATRKSSKGKKLVKIVCAQPQIVFEQSTEKSTRNIPALNDEAKRFAQSESTKIRFSASFEIGEYS